MIRRAAGTATAALALAAAGCRDYAVTRVRTERGRYRPGAAVTAVATNVSRREIVLANLCRWRLERAAGRAWELVVRSPGPDTACVLTASPILPGERVTTTVRLPPRLPPGRYRIEFPGLTRERGLPLPEAERRTVPFELR